MGFRPSDLTPQYSIAFPRSALPRQELLAPEITVFTWSHFYFLQVEASHSHLYDSTPNPVPAASDPPPEGKC